MNFKSIIKGEYIVYVDESGDHNLKKINNEYPIFVITFCCFKISEYVNLAVPALQHFKFKYFGHDQIVLHESDIRKNKGPFTILRSSKVIRENFMTDLNGIIQDIPFDIISVIVNKEQLKLKYVEPFNPYHLGLRFGLERLNQILLRKNQKGKEICLIFEQRGKREDSELELEFLRICAKKEQFGYTQTIFGDINFRFMLADKKSNSSGLQIADLTARPIGLNYLRPDQENRAYSIIAKKIVSDKEFP